MAFEPKLLDKPLTPIEALEWRSELVRWIKGHIIEVVSSYYSWRKTQAEKQGLDFHKPPQEELIQIANEVGVTAHEMAAAELLLWDRPMVEFAVSGQKLFYGIPVPDDVSSRPSELWLNNYDVRQHGRDAAPQLELVSPNTEQGVIVQAINFALDGNAHPPLIFTETILIPGHIHPDPFKADSPIPFEDGRGVITMARIEFLKSKIVGSDKESLPRRIRRQAEREIKHEPIVRVIRLRRKEQSQGSESGGSIDYQYQWLVRPHWRNQYHPSTGERKPVFIDAYVKGPEDKPFKPPKDYVFKVDR